MEIFKSPEKKNPGKRSECVWKGEGLWFFFSGQMEKKYFFI